MSRRSKSLVVVPLLLCLIILTGNHFPNSRIVGAALRGRPVFLRYSSTFKHYTNVTNAMATECRPHKSSASSAGAQTPQVPVYYVTRSMKPIRVDGRLNDLAWQKAPLVGDFVNNSDGSRSQYKTEAKVLYDEHFLYFAFRCADTNIWSTMRRRDQHLWLEEVVEVFLQADEINPNYIELEVNPLGALLDIYMLAARKPLHYESWNSEKLRWAVKVDGTIDGRSGDRQWTCEIALPMEDIVTAPHNPPLPGDRWRMNLYRGEHYPAPAGLAWSPTLQDDFHIPQRFGELVFR
jgi:hypothetical protein